MFLYLFCTFVQHTNFCIYHNSDRKLLILLVWSCLCCFSSVHLNCYFFYVQYLYLFKLTSILLLQVSLDVYIYAYIQLHFDCFVMVSCVTFGFIGWFSLFNFTKEYSFRGCGFILFEKKICEKRVPMFRQHDSTEKLFLAIYIFYNHSMQRRSINKAKSLNQHK